MGKVKELNIKNQTVKKYLILDSTEKYEEVFSGIKKEIKTINGEKELIYEKNYGKKYPEAKKSKNNEQDSVCTIF